MDAVHFTSNRDDWETPKALYDQLNKEFNFAVDAACTDNNGKAPILWTKQKDALSFSWADELLAIRDERPNLAPTIFCNPPYGRDINLWFAKAAEAADLGVTVVMLVPNRPRICWFEHIYESEGEPFVYGYKPQRGRQVRILRNRLFFEFDGEPITNFKGQRQSAPFPSAILVFKNWEEGDDGS